MAKIKRLTIPNVGEVWNDEKVHTPLAGQHTATIALGNIG